MSKSKIYTRTGDKGETSLVGGTRLAKSAERIDLYGDIDELNSHLGHSLSLMKADKILRFEGIYTSIQSALFDIGSRLACEEENWEKFKLPNVESSKIVLMEKLMDELDQDLPKLKNFILPGGGQSGAYLNICRTVCRRVERKMVSFSNQGGHNLPENSLEFMNRLSDLLFVIGRYVNFEMGIEESTWRG